MKFRNGSKSDHVLDQSPSAPSPDVEGRKSSIMDADALRLAELGYTQDMRRNFSIWSLLGVGFSLTNSWYCLLMSFSAVPD